MLPKDDVQHVRKLPAFAGGLPVDPLMKIRLKDNVNADIVLPGASSFLGLFHVGWLPIMLLTVLFIT